MPQQIDEITPGAAAGIEDLRSGRNAAAEELIEEVDVDCAELVDERLQSKGILPQGRKDAEKQRLSFLFVFLAPLRLVKCLCFRT